MRHARITVAAIAIAAAATVGTFTIASAGSGSASNHSTNAGNSATVQTATATVQGTTETILVDSKGLPLYTFSLDTPTTSRVTGQLAALWPPLDAGAPTVRDAGGSVTSVPTSNGRQVAYNGHFLYTFVDDSPGHVTGQGVQNFFVATPGPAAPAAAAPTDAPAQTSNGY
jgi:predicted lipoprotein with Yx(FWY)xxD motif